MNCNGDAKIAAAASFFESALRLWGNLPSCRAVERGGVLLVSTGTAVADQNYALRTGGGDIKGMVRVAGEFFRSEGMPYSWWIPPGREAAAESAGVAGAGLPLLCSPPAMVMSLRGEGLSRAAPRGLEFIICRNSAEAGEWAAASLSGFGSGPEHLGAFSAFACAMAAGPSAERSGSLRCGRRYGRRDGHAHRRARDCGAVLFLGDAPIPAAKPGVGPA